MSKGSKDQEGKKKQKLVIVASNIEMVEDPSFDVQAELDSHKFIASTESMDEVELNASVHEEYSQSLGSSTEYRDPSTSTRPSDTAEKLKGKVTETELNNVDPDDFSMMIKKCFDVRDLMIDQSSIVVATEEAGIPGVGGLIGGDIAEIFQKSVKLGIARPPGLSSAHTPKELRAQSGKNRTPKLKIVAQKKAQDSNGVALPLDSVEKKSNGRRLLSTTPSSSRTKTSGGPDAVGNFGKKHPVSSPVGKASPFPKPCISSPGRGKSLGSGTSSTQEKSNRLSLRTQTGRGRADLGESPLAADLDLSKLKAKRTSTDFTRLFKTTTSSAAKIAVAPGSSNSTPSKASHSTYPVTKSTTSMGDADAGTAAETQSTTPIPGNGDAGTTTLKEQFGVFSRFGDSASDGKQITLSNCDKWMKQAHVIDGKKLTTTDTSITFKKLFKTTKRVGFDDFKRYINDLAKNKGMEGNEILEKLSTCGTPGLSQGTRSANASVVSRLTDTSKYTGSHKERFDASGKGRGMEGRRDLKNTTGYVAAFKDKQETSQSPTPK